MIAILYLVAAALLALAPHLGGVPHAALRCATITAWFGATVAIVGCCVQLFGIATVRTTPLPLLRLSVAEEERGQGSFLWWWTPFFALFLILAGLNALSMIALSVALLRWPISIGYVRAARARLDAVKSSAGTPETDAVYRLECVDGGLIVRRSGWWCEVYEIDPDGSEQLLGGESGKILAERFERLVSAPTPSSSPVPAPYVLHATTGFPATKSWIHGGRESAESENVVVIVDREVRRPNGGHVLTLTPAHQSQWLSQLCSIAADAVRARG